MPLLAASYISTANAGNISFFCQAGYVCDMQISYLDSANKGALKTWDSGSFDVGQTKTFTNKDNQQVLAATAYAVFIGNIKIKAFTGLDPKVDYKGKMWGTIGSPQACLTEDGAGCA